jgi:hypothetical protein
VSVRPVLDRWPTLRDSLSEDCEEKFTSLREAKGSGARWHGGLRNRTGTSAWQTDCPSRAPGAQGRGDPVGAQLNLAAMGKLSPY